MKYRQRFTPHELMKKTVEDINRKRKMEKEGQRQAFIHCMENRIKIQKRISYGKY